MASHFSTIGFNVQNNDDFRKISAMTGENGEMIESKKGDYYKWCLAHGIELWAQADKKSIFMGLNPHFQGESKLRVKIDRKIKRKDLTPLDASLLCYADATPEASEGVYPFVVDLPNFQVYDDIKIPQFTEIQIAAFAHEVKIFSTEEEYFKSQDSETKFAIESFIPSGLFYSDDKNHSESEAYAIFSGKVLKAKEIYNEIDERKFFYLVVKTLGGNYDVLIDTDIVEQYPKVGNIISGSFWLSGKISENYERKPLNFLKKLLSNIF